jgi:hypothetical protein
VLEAEFGELAAAYQAELRVSGAELFRRFGLPDTPAVS